MGELVTVFDWAAPRHFQDCHPHVPSPSPNPL